MGVEKADGKGKMEGMFCSVIYNRGIVTAAGIKKYFHFNGPEDFAPDWQLPLFSEEIRLLLMDGHVD